MTWQQLEWRLARGRLPDTKYCVFVYPIPAAAVAFIEKVFNVRIMQNNNVTRRQWKIDVNVTNTIKKYWKITF